MSTLRAVQPTSALPNISQAGHRATVGRTCITVAGIPFDDVTMQEAVQEIAWMAEQTDRARHICTGNLDHLVILENDPVFRTAYETADLVLADGMPIVWLSHLQNKKQQQLRERVTGSDLFWELGRVSAQKGARLFFLGGAPGAAVRAADAVRQKYPLACIAGTYCPSFEAFGTPEEEERITEEIRNARPDILLVGLGAPKQEKWILQNKERLGIPVSIGVGGSFEMASGLQRRAPVWMQHAGLEWCYRMGQEPGRLTKRYLGRDLPFLMHLLTRGKRGSSSPHFQRRSG
ncbi:MAG: WecB/TagA/CpsF family glycosyltransferase [Fibrella sp.]|nr:WecB/TagA/CpsF family glycosyltransferase [Armatimonadota bacterium]